MTTALHRFLAVATIVLSIWAYGILGNGPLANFAFYGVIVGVLSFGVHCVYQVISRALGINDVPEAFTELQKEIAEAQKELRAKKIID
ncbi:unnamed protein product [Bursaphelenchus xylophilus]|uniref:Dolichol-phosphate mannosyltransferase subunit 3 n=1 Tax=Bursaphelenchus xylophilus TaxID=6326 RepID=A0A1I7SBU9_BURXY|nr:unnamed protein product [Bursaphelenchus xylophilus]CAG9113006.1 unnamed protein product [Bursaphelenchus xylophilus]